MARHRRIEMRTLVELQERSLLALGFETLVRFASSMAPTAAYEKAIGKGWSREQAQSCRFLAAMRRDYGEQAFQNAIASYKTSEVKANLTKNVLPRIQLLEGLAGAPLRIVRPQGIDITFAEWLKSLPVEINVDLSLGDFTVALQIGVKESTFQGTTNHFSEVSYALKDKEGAVLTKCQYSSGFFENGKEQDAMYVANSSLHKLIDIIGDGYYFMWPERPSLSAAIRTYFEKQGEPMPPRLWESKEVMGYVNAGIVDCVEEAIAELRTKAVADSVKPQFLACFDFDAKAKMERAKQQWRHFDPNVSLIDKVQDGTIGCMIGADCIAGERMTKTYSFFLWYECGMDVDAWADALAAHGYGGSVLYYSFNNPTGYAIAETGQLDGLLVDNDRVHWLIELEKDLTANHKKIPPHFVGYVRNSEFSRYLGVFLKEHFPLK